MLTSAVQYIIILACTAILTSSGCGRPCLCLHLSKGVRVPFNLIVRVKEYPPRPYCNRKEVIITLTTGRKMCLDPSEKYTKQVLKKIKAREAAKKIIATTTAATETPTETPTETQTVPVPQTGLD